MPDQPATRARNWESLWEKTRECQIPRLAGGGSRVGVELAWGRAKVEVELGLRGLRFYSFSNSCTYTKLETMFLSLIALRDALLLFCADFIPLVHSRNIPTNLDGKTQIEALILAAGCLPASTPPCPLQLPLDAPRFPNWSPLFLSLCPCVLPK